MAARAAQPFVPSFMAWEHRGAAQRNGMTTPEAWSENLVEPLTHCNLQGVRYRREPAVEAQIAQARALGPADLVARAQLVDKSDPRYLQEETLSYLIRRAHRGAEDTLVNDLAEVLVARCTAYLKATLRPLQQGKLEEVIADALAEIFEKLVEPVGSDAGDFLQVRFWVVVKRLGWAAHKRAVEELQRESIFVTLEPTGDGFEDDEDRALEIEDRVTPPVDTQLLNDEALSLLEPNLREAFVLKVEGWPIEDRDPNIMTISKHFGKTSRTIRNWIAEAEKQLAAWRDEEVRS
jgi:DNA-directed RNA polymerase specialized sigma24 family protein